MNGCKYCANPGITISHTCSRCVGRFLASLHDEGDAQRTALVMESHYPFTAEQMIASMHDYNNERRQV